VWLETGRLRRLSRPRLFHSADESFLGYSGWEEGLVGDHLDFVRREFREGVPRHVNSSGNSW